MKKRTLSLLAVFALVLGLLTGCGDQGNSSGSSSQSDGTSATEKTTVNVGALKGPTGIGMVQLMDQNDHGKTANNYNFTLAGDPQDMVGKISNGDLDIAAVPTNLAANLYKKTSGNVQLVAINTLGNLSILERGESIQSVEDLKGKTIYATGQGSNPEYVLDYILKANGLDPETDVTIIYKSEHSELATLMASGEVDIALLPEPYVTSVLNKSEDVRVAIDVTKAWDEAAGESGSQLAMGCIIVRKDFLENNQEAFDAFMKEYEESTNWVVSNVSDAAQLVGKYEIMDAAVAEKAIPNCNITFLKGEEMKKAAQGFFQVLFDEAPQSIGGSMPEDGLYYLGE